MYRQPGACQVPRKAAPHWPISISQSNSNAEKSIMSKLPEFFIRKTIVITGATSGIGRAPAQIFARKGANVVCGDINVEGAERTANQIIQKRRQVSRAGLRCDEARAD
jgi:NADPH:quinone reductase-like Zn-dependent oxidoreductase